MLFINYYAYATVILPVPTVAPFATNVALIPVLTPNTPRLGFTSYINTPSKSFSFIFINKFDVATDPISIVGRVPLNAVNIFTVIRTTRLFAGTTPILSNDPESNVKLIDIDSTSSSPLRSVLTSNQAVSV